MLVRVDQELRNIIDCLDYIIVFMQTICQGHHEISTPLQRGV
jgi:hypothetical protein